MWQHQILSHISVSRFSVGLQDLWWLPVCRPWSRWLLQWDSLPVCIWAPHCHVQPYGPNTVLRNACLLLLSLLNPLRSIWWRRSIWCKRVNLSTLLPCNTKVTISHHVKVFYFFVFDRYLFHHNKYVWTIPWGLVRGVVFWTRIMSHFKDIPQVVITVCRNVELVNGFLPLYLGSHTFNTYNI